MNSLISIIVPVYNVAEYLPKCVNSLLAQTYTNLEILLVDDGATDPSGCLCDEYAALDRRVRVIHKENGGVSSARNTGLEAMSGEYVMFVDADDYLPQEAVACLFRRLTEDGSDMCVGKHVDVFEDGSVNETACQWMRDGVVTRDEFMRMPEDARQLPVVCWGKLYKAECFRGLRFGTLSCGEDLWIFPDLLEKCESISVVDRCVYYYVQRGTSVMHNLSDPKRAEDTQATLRMTEYLWNHGVKRGACTWYKESIQKALNMKDRQKGRQLFAEHLDETIHLQIRKAVSSKIRVLWLCLRYPALYRILTAVKKFCK